MLFSPALLCRADPIIGNAMAVERLQFASWSGFSRSSAGYAMLAVFCLDGK
jgi:hypothetical protein